MIEAAPCQTAAIPKMCAISKLFKLLRQGCFHCTVPKRLFFIKLHIRIEYAG